MHKATRTVLISFLVILIFLFGVWLRIKSILPANILFDYDQYEDLFRVRQLATLENLPIIGPAIYSNPNLHHGVFFYYYSLLPYLLSGGSPVGIAIWNSIVNAAASIVLFFLARSLFKSTLIGLTAALLVATSPEFVKYAGWLSNPTTLLTLVPLFFFSLWSYYQKRPWGLPTGAFLLGIIFQSELFFLYLIPTVVLYWLILKPPWPNCRLAITSVGVFFLAVLTFILTEIKLKLAGVIALLQLPLTSDEAQISLPQRIDLLLQDVGYELYYNFWPQASDEGWYIGSLLLFVALVFLIKERKRHPGIAPFLVLYLLAPLLMLLIGYHQKPWFLIGLPPVLLLLTAYSLSKLKVLVFIPVLAIAVNNSIYVLYHQPPAHQLFKALSSSQLSYQLAVINYTYQTSGGQPFVINTVTFPLYHNALWEYNYDWYGAKKYGFLPGWLGTDRLPPYNILPKATGRELFFYLIIEDTYRIPEYHKWKAKLWADEQGDLIEEKKFEGFIVQKRKRYLQ